MIMLSKGPDELSKNDALKGDKLSGSDWKAARGHSGCISATGKGVSELKDVCSTVMIVFKFM